MLRTSHGLQRVDGTTLELAQHGYLEKVVQFRFYRAGAYVYLLRKRALSSASNNSAI